MRDRAGGGFRWLSWSCAARPFSRGLKFASRAEPELTNPREPKWRKYRPLLLDMVGPPNEALFGHEGAWLVLSRRLRMFQVAIQPQPEKEREAPSRPLVAARLSGAGKRMVRLGAGGRWRRPGTVVCRNSGQPNGCRGCARRESATWRCRPSPARWTRALERSAASTAAGGPSIEAPNSAFGARAVLRTPARLVAPR